jgi:hypothetical protein
VRSIAEADRALERLFHVAGGVDRFLSEHAVIVMSDHSQTPVHARINLSDALAGWQVLAPVDPAPEGAQLAACPAARSAMVYVLLEEERRRAAPRVAHDLRAVEGLDLIVRLDGDEAVVWSHRGELRFAPGGDVRDDRGERWRLEGDREALRLAVDDGRVTSDEYPDALARLWSALCCPHAGDVLVSAAPGYEFVDWGGADHVGGGSHGSLHRDDSLGVLITCGLDAPAREHWSIADVASLVLGHFSISS